MNNKENRMYMMPTVFGPALTPRQSVNGKRYIDATPTQYNRSIICYETDYSILQSLVPEGFEVTQPYVIIDYCMLKNVAWLAGRGYNTLGIAIPVKYSSDLATTQGMLLTVLWENHADPIITGREQLGFSKIYADITNINEDKPGVYSVDASSWEFSFFNMEINTNESAEDQNKLFEVLNLKGDGMLHHKYIPKTGDGFFKGSVDEIVLSPSNWIEPDKTILKNNLESEICMCSGSFSWKVPSWEQMPTQSHIIQKLNQLEVKKMIGAVKSLSYSSNDYFSQRIL